MDLTKSIGFKMGGRTMAFLTRALDYRRANQNVIAGNLANIDTPGFQPKKLRFDQALAQAVDQDKMKLRKTNPGHFPLPPDVGSNHFTLVSRETNPSGTLQSSLDREMADIMKNNLLYEASARLISKKIETLRTVITGRS